MPFKNYKKNNISNNSSLLEIYNPHNLPPLINIQESKIGIFIDIGIRNMAIRKSIYKDDKIVGIYQNVMDFDLSKQKIAQKRDLDKRSEIGKSNDKFSLMTRTFNNLSDMLYNSHYIVIEKQLNVSPLNQKVMNMLIGIIMNIVMDEGYRPIIIEIDAKLKSKYFEDSPKGKYDKKLLKEWASTKAIELLTLNDNDHDREIINNLNNMSKKDDMGDVVCYCYAWWNYILPAYDTLIHGN